MKVVAWLVLLSSSAPAQWLNYPSTGIPRTPDGKPNLSAPAPKKDGNPDLTGIWRIARPSSIPAGTGSYASLQYWTKEGVDISFQPWAKALYEQRYASFGAGRPSERTAMTVGVRVERPIGASTTPRSSATWPSTIP